MIERVVKVTAWAGEYQGVYRLPGGKLSRIRLHTRDKVVAQRRLRAVVAEAEHESVGLIPRAKQREAQGRPLSDHLAEFTAELRSVGRDSMYVRCVGWRLGKLFLGCSWMMLSDLSSSGFVKWRAGCGLSPKSCNDYLADLAHFVRWLVKRGRLSVDPLGEIERVDTARAEHYRRAFTPGELRRLLAVSGDRAVPYLVAALTGLRRKELAALRWDDVVLSDGGACVLVRASIAKNAKCARIDLHPDAAAALASLRSGAAGPLVFGPGGLPDVSVLKADLAAAGLSFKDDLGRRLDFHAFRGTFATMLVASGATIPLTQQLMRHADFRQTEKHYADRGQFPAAAALQLLPRFPLGVDPNFCNLLASPAGQNQSLPVSACPKQNSEQTVANSGDCRVLAGAVINSQNGANTAPARAQTLRKVASAGSKTPFGTKNCNLATGSGAANFPPGRGRRGQVRGCRGVDSPPRHLPASFWRMMQSARGRRELRALAACWDCLDAGGRRTLMAVGGSMRKGGRRG